ncbi:amino acid racemase [Orrella sp. JC864]|uniref:aspartate/glutamate racemase family protein n=1 Tax=Orrella sp. JC864 TaxID=3120298 RepID=UPI0012BBCDEE
MNTPRPCFLGVLGGMGPLAGASFALRLAALTPADTDQQHIPTLLLNDPRIPDRSSARLQQGADPLPGMLAGLRQLNAAGVQCVAIPCNTAHLWFESLQQASSAPILHIVDAAADDLRRQGLASGRIGLMGTAATLALGLYQDILARRGYECLLPTPEEMQDLCIPAIQAVKSNRLEHAQAPAIQCIARLAQRGAQAVVLGCTELPLAVPHAMRQALPVPVTDSIDALALAAIDHYVRARTAAAQA